MEKMLYVGQGTDVKELVSSAYNEFYLETGLVPDSVEINNVNFPKIKNSKIKVNFILNESLENNQAIVYRVAKDATVIH